MRHPRTGTAKNLRIVRYSEKTKQRRAVGMGCNSCCWQQLLRQQQLCYAMKGCIRCDTYTLCQSNASCLLAAAAAAALLLLGQGLDYYYFFFVGEGLSSSPGKQQQQTIATSQLRHSTETDAMSDITRLREKVFLVYGADNGIGHELVELLARCGARLVLAGSNRKR